MNCKNKFSSRLKHYHPFFVPSFYILNSDHVLKNLKYDIENFQNMNFNFREIIDISRQFSILLLSEIKFLEIKSTDNDDVFVITRTDKNFSNSLFTTNDGSWDFYTTVSKTLPKFDTIIDKIYTPMPIRKISFGATNSLVYYKFYNDMFLFQSLITCGEKIKNYYFLIE